AATAPEDTTTTSRPIRCAATTKPAIAPAYSVDRPPPLAASRLLPTLSTARRQGGSICSVKSWGAMASAGVPLVHGEVGSALGDQRVAHRDRACLLQPRQAVQQVGAAAAVAEAAAQFEHALRAQVVEECEVRRDQRLVEAGAPHQHDQVTRRAHSASQRARSASRRRSAAAPGEVRAARLPSGVRPCPAVAAPSAAARYASRNGTPVIAASTATSVAYMPESIAARSRSSRHSRLASSAGSSSSAPRPRLKPWKIAPFEACRSRW